MLLIDIPRIPPEGLDLDEALEPPAVHLEGDEELSLRPGGRLRAHVEVMDGSTLHVRGRLDAAVETDCARCLERHAVGFGQELDLFYLPRAAEQEEAQEEEVELSDRDVVVGYYQDDRLDLGEVVREQILLALPLKPLCRPDCQGLCPRCGKNRNVSPCGCAPEQEPGDPRLEPLRRLIDRNRK
ncbi:MAG TPA: DUF177 domain-containing protein [Vicinamibacteria bacterium]|jgi:uncharacterized protein|nr:DUF177 domain-containing protein [Vicinamibacteria bacterium]